MPVFEIYRDDISSNASNIRYERKIIHQHLTQFHCKGVSYQYCLY